MHEHECVILLHGLARHAGSMNKMAEALREHGYRVVNADYPSRKHPIRRLARIAVGDGLQMCSALRGVERVHVVTHSLGGILIRQYAADNAIGNLGRVVMLAPPNQGSAAADRLRKLPGYRWLNGPAGDELGQGAGSVPLKLGKPDFEFAVIAGDRTIDPFTSLFLDNPDDGRVSVADTKLDGMRDFRVIHVSHAFIMKNPQAIDLTLRFLAHGRFDDDARSGNNE